jgi:hypothetical protein
VESLESLPDDMIGDADLNIFRKNRMSLRMQLENSSNLGYSEYFIAEEIYILTPYFSKLG